METSRFRPPQPSRAGRPAALRAARPRVRVPAGGARAAGAVPGSPRRGTKPGRPPAAASQEGAPGAQGARPEGARTARAPARSCAGTRGLSPTGPQGRGARGSLTDLHALEQRAFAVARAGDIGLPGGEGGGAVDPHQAVHGRRGGSARGARGTGAAGGGSGRRPALGPRMQEARGREGAPRLAGLGAPPSSRGAAGLSARGRAPLRPPAAPRQPRGRRQCPRVASGKWAGSRGARCRRG